MPHCTSGRLAGPLHRLRAQFGPQDGLPFGDVLPADQVEQAFRDAGLCWRERVFSPALTLWAFLSQALSPDGSCRAAVARVVAWLASQGQRPCAATTGAYCKARGRLPEAALRRLAHDTGRALHRQASDGWRWHGRRVKVVDGATLSMPDTPANQQAYPQHNAQRPGLGFPLMRVVTLFCLATGAVVEAALGRYQGKRSGENALLRDMDEGLEPGDVLLGDCACASYFDLAHRRARGVDAVVRMHQCRRVDFRRGRRLGPADHVVTWERPKRPAWMDAETYAQVPETMEVREVRVQVRQKGFRTRVYVVATTLLDAEAYPAEDLGELYRVRWQAELHLRSLKVVLGMDVLRCLTPEMVRKEVWVHLLAYNLLRTVMAQAAQGHGLEPWQISFKGALQTVLAFAEALAQASALTLPVLYAALLAAVASHRVGDRPDRVEPRKRKRRPKHYPYLTQPRDEARKALMPRS
jgi:Transposase DDE domain/Insertion element 4 transposase N-terminal